MSSTLNRRSFQELVNEDRKWLSEQPHSLEHIHIEQILNTITRIIYDDKCECGKTHIDNQLGKNNA